MWVFLIFGNLLSRTRSWLSWTPWISARKRCSFVHLGSRWRTDELLHLQLGLEHLHPKEPGLRSWCRIAVIWEERSGVKELEKTKTRTDLQNSVGPNITWFDTKTEALEILNLIAIIAIIAIPGHLRRAPAWVLAPRHSGGFASGYPWWDSARCAAANGPQLSLPGFSEASRSVIEQTQRPSNLAYLESFTKVKCWPCLDHSHVSETSHSSHVYHHKSGS